MAVEIMPDPLVETHENTTRYIYAKDTSDPPRALGSVTLTQELLHYYNGLCVEIPGLARNVTHVDGQVDNETIYKKEVMERGILGIPLPFYGFRVALAQRRAAKQVSTALQSVL